MIRKSSEHVGEPSAEINILEPADGNTAQCSLGAAVEAIGDGLGNPIAAQDLVRDCGSCRTAGTMARHRSHSRRRNTGSHHSRRSSHGAGGPAASSGQSRPSAAGGRKETTIIRNS